jgi:hypothetical protein
VKENAAELDKRMPMLLKAVKGKFATFNKGTLLLRESYENALNVGLSVFGKDVGFVVREITDEPIIFSKELQEAIKRSQK